MPKTSPNDPGIKIKNRKKNDFFIKSHVKVIISSKMTILTLLQHLKPIKTDGKSIVDQDSLNITSVAPLGCPFMPKQDPTCVKQNQKRNTNAGGALRPAAARPPRSCYVFDFFITNKRSCTVQYCTVLYSTVQYCTETIILVCRMIVSM